MLVSALHSSFAELGRPSFLRFSSESQQSFFPLEKPELMGFILEEIPKLQIKIWSDVDDEHIRACAKTLFADLVTDHAVHVNVHLRWRKVYPFRTRYILSLDLTYNRRGLRDSKLCDILIQSAVVFSTQSFFDQCCKTMRDFRYWGRDPMIWRKREIEIQIDPSSDKDALVKFAKYRAEPRSPA